ncbi:hypothetical protein Ciccas_009231, partial [Cichlidogyrus casuarinus]
TTANISYSPSSLELPSFEQTRMEPKNHKSSSSSSEQSLLVQRIAQKYIHDQIPISFRPPAASSKLNYENSPSTEKYLAKFNLINKESDGEDPVSETLILKGLRLDQSPLLLDEEHQSDFSENYGGPPIISPIPKWF